jgi:hypothetical protein
MNEGRLARWSPISAIVFVVLFAVGIALDGDIPGAGSSDAKILAYYGDGGKQVKLQIAYYLVTLAAVFLVWFVGTLAARIRRLGDWATRPAYIVIGSGTAASLLFLAGFAANSLVASTANHTSRFHIDPDTARVISDFSYPLTFETALPFAAPFVIAATVALRRAGKLPRWFGRAGVAVGLLCLAGFLAIPMGLFLLWLVAVAVVLLRDRRTPRAVESPEAAPVT